MGSKKSKKSKDSNYMNLLSLQNAPWVISRYALAHDVNASSIKELTPKQALQYCGVPIALIEVYFKNQPALYLTSNDLDITTDGKRYKSEADLKKISALTSKEEINKDGQTITLSSVDDAFLDVIQRNAAFDATVIIKAGFMSPDDELTAKFLLSRGLIGGAVHKVDPDKGTTEINFKTVSVNSKLDKIPGNRPAESVQQARHAGDRFFEYSGLDETEEWKVKS